MSVERLGDVFDQRLSSALGGAGVWLDIGLVTIRVRGSSAAMPAQLKAAYPHFPFVAQGPWADLHVALEPPSGLRRWVKPQVAFWCDGGRSFDPFPADSPLPMFEWGCNYFIGRRGNHDLLLHAGALERDGLALLLPAEPGSGKSTLTAALAHRGWRLLSDEFAAVSPDDGAVRAVLKPVCLKNASIDVIRRFAPQARFGPVFAHTRRGPVAHVAALRAAVDQRHVPASPALVVFPRWQAGHATELGRLDALEVFSRLSGNAFNYRVLGRRSFELVCGLAERVQGWTLTYSDLEDALPALERLHAEIRDGWAHGGRAR